MARRVKGWLLLTAAAALVLAGCESGTGPLAKRADGTTDSVAARASSPSAVSVETEVEAPQVFKLTGAGLWDGRPSLGGVWVAHPSVTNPERVMIRNTKNGKSVIGALFRRERDNPGPALQVSSDAAEELGLLAGAPTELSVVALRKEEKTLPAPETSEPQTAAVGSPAAVVAGAAPAADGKDAVAAAGAEVAAQAAPVEKPKRGLFGGLFKKKPKPEPATEPAAIADGASAQPIEQSTLEPVTATAAAGIAAAEAKQKAAPKPAAAPAGPAFKRAYVQIGIFTLEANARRAAGQMKTAGMTATVVADQSQGKNFWRVIVGPAASVAERDALVTRVKGVGYPDAYPVTK